MRTTPFLSFISSCALAASAWAQPVVPLWTGDAPGSEGRTGEPKVRIADRGERVVSGIHRPDLTVYLPAAGRATGAGVVVCPGGGHRELWTDHEGHAVARWLADRGIAAFVLKYRLAREEGSTYRVDVEALADAQRALRLVRHRAAEWQVDPARLGILGFSAGGELAGLAARRSEPARPGQSDPVEQQSSRPAFQALIYPGRSASIEPAAGHPPAFLLCGFNDRPDISEGLAQVYLRFKQAGVPAELHILAGTGHGFGLRPDTPAPLAGWPERLHEWLSGQGFLRGSP
ncbi:MAG TPA: alpha/beta hydrolase [Opitutaceae bacterium]|nr:alpha/beta hydrolase [Opitutaceae bacterium]